MITGAGLKACLMSSRRGRRARWRRVLLMFPRLCGRRHQRLLVHQIPAPISTAPLHCDLRLLSLGVSRADRAGGGAERLSALTSVDAQSHADGRKTPGADCRIPGIPVASATAILDVLLVLLALGAQAARLRRLPTRADHAPHLRLDEHGAGAARAGGCLPVEAPERATSRCWATARKPACREPRRARSILPRFPGRQMARRSLRDCGQCRLLAMGSPSSFIRATGSPI